MRTLVYLSEAPVGYPITDKYSEETISSESVWTDASENGLPMVGDDAEPGAACAASLASGEFTTSAFCFQHDNDGIYILTCQTKYRRQSHDAQGGPPAGRHCFSSYNRWSGPNSNRCMGKCGPNCNWYKGWGYTQDCLEHDTCSFDHNASGGAADDNCGDEYDDAYADWWRTSKGECRRV